MKRQKKLGPRVKLVTGCLYQYCGTGTGACAEAKAVQLCLNV
jgi:hypothetical protein